MVILRHFHIDLNPFLSDKGNIIDFGWHIKEGYLGSILKTNSVAQNCIEFSSDL